MSELTESYPPRTRADWALMEWMLVALYLAVITLMWHRLYGFARRMDSSFLSTLDVLAWTGMPIALGIAWFEGIIPRRQPRSRVPDLPALDSTVLYRLYAADGELLYAGITQRPERRMRDHARDKEWWPEIARKEIRAYQTREDAARAEHAVIMRENPRYNVARYDLEAHLRSAAAR